MKRVFGIHAVKALLEHQADTIEKIYVLSGKVNPRLAQLMDLAISHRIVVHREDHKALAELVSGEKHQGIVASVNEELVATEKLDLMSLVKSISGPAFLLVLDSIQDPHNLGACLRTADATGVHAVIAPKDKSVGITPVVSKVACGADQTTPFYQVTNLARTLEQLKEMGIWVLGAAGETDSSIYQQDFTGNIALVMGNEGSGLRRLTRDTCDNLFSIPMLGSIESLNVSVATAVCLYEVVRQRGW